MQCGTRWRTVLFTVTGSGVSVYPLSALHSLVSIQLRTRSASRVLMPRLQEELPYKFIALQGLRDLIDHGGNRLLPLVPHLIIPLRQALNTRRHAVMVAAMDAIKQLLVTDLHAPDGPMMAKAFVPYFRQLLPIFNIFILNNYNLGDKTHYGQRRNDVLGDRIEEVRVCVCV